MLVGKKWLSGYAVVKTSPPPWYMLVGKRVAMQLCGYAVVKTSPPPWYMLVEKRVAMQLRGYAVVKTSLPLGICQ